MGELVKFVSELVVKNRNHQNMKDKAIFLRIVLVVITAINLQYSFAQNGPGGVGNNDGSDGQPGLLFWLRADSINLANNNPVNAWNDISGNNHHFLQTSATNQPVYSLSAINGQPAVVFDGNNDYLLDDNAEDYINGISGFTFISVIKSDETGSDAGFFDTEDPDGADDLIAIRYDNGGATGGGDDVIKVGVNTSAGSTQQESSALIQTTSPQLYTLQWSDGDVIDLYKDGGFDTPTAASSNLSGTIQGTTKALIGRGPKDASDGWNGMVAEMIFFNESISSAHRNIVENYLSEKYNIAIGNDLISGITATYNHAIAGIGEEIDGEHSIASSSGLYLTALSGLGVGDYVFASHNNAINNSLSFRTDAEVTSAGAVEAYNRLWYIEKVNTPTARIAFDFGEALEDGMQPSNVSNYILLYRSGTTGNFTKIKNADGIENGDQVYFDLSEVQLQTGYYTLATENDMDSPLEGIPGYTWYTLISGDWDNWEIWTLDPSGALPNNPDNYTPSTSPTSATDHVVILTGRTVDVTSDNKINKSIEIDGRLDLQSTTGHAFETIRGTGRVIMYADNFPTGNASHFYTKGEGEGTVVFKGNSYSLPTSREFFDVEIELNNNTDIITLMTDYTINGNLIINKGKFQINDNTNTNTLDLTVDGDLTVESNGSIGVGTADAYNSSAQTGYGNYHKGYHIVTVGGNLTNNGTIRLTNQVVPDYKARATNGAASLVFSGIENAGMACYNTTDLYYLVIDKGTDRTYELNIYADNKAYFALYGDNDENWNTTDPANPETRKALWIKNGTLRLSGNVSIPSLSEGSRDFTIGQHAGLVLDGPNVFVGNTANENSDWTGYSYTTPTNIDNGGGNQGLYVLGKLQVDNGHYYLGEAEAINFRDEAAGIIEVNGGLLEVNQIAISSSASLGNYSFAINGGVVRLTREYGGDNGRALLNLDTEDMVFTMTGGELYIEDITSHDPNCIHISSKEGNYNVTGGTLYIDVNNTATVRSTAPFYDVVINSGTLVTLQEELIALGDLTIESGATLNTAGYDVSIGDNFIYEDGASYIHGNNTTHFIGNNAAYIYVMNAANANNLVFNNLDINKDQRYNTSLFHRLYLRSVGGRAYTDAPILIEGNLSINRGDFDVEQWQVNLNGNIEIIDGQITATNSPEGKINLNGTVQQTLKGALNVEQSFGNIELNNTNGAKLLTDVNVENFTLTQGVMNLDLFNITITETLNGSGFGNTLMFETAGNASDGGLTLPVILEDRTYTNETVVNFPIGSAGVYNPSYIYVDGNPNATSGSVTMNGVDGIPPSASTGNALTYYWVVETDGFTGINNAAINYVMNYPGGFSNGWQCMWLIDGTTDWEKSNDDASPLAYYYDIGMTSGDFAVGNPSGFNNLTIFYSRVANGNWTDKNSWSNDSYGGAASNKTPSTYDIVKIGYSGSPGAYQRHRITLNTGSPASPVEIAELVLEQNPEAGAVETDMSRLIIPPTRGLKVNGKISGDGEVQFQMDGTNIPTFEGDFGEFANTEGASFIMRSNNGNVIAPTNITRFPRLSIPGATNDWIDSRSVTFTTDIYCHNLNVRYGGTLLLNNGADGDIEVRDSLRIGGIGTDNSGRIIYQNNGTPRTIKIGGNLILDTDGVTYDNNQLYVETGGTDNLEHELRVEGNIFLRNPGSVLDLYTANDGAQSNVIVHLTGEEDGYFLDENNTVPELYRIVMNKQENDDFSFQSNFTLNGPNNGDSKALELISGRLMLQHADIDIDLSSGGADFIIPAEATLYTGNQATVRITGDNTGIFLDGKIHAGWATKWYLNGGVNNYIEYSSSGNAEIDIFQTEFYVGSQIRRSTLTEGGILRFQQNHANSTVVIGTNANLGGEPSRGVFELVNTGSYFSQVQDAKISIANSVNNASVPTFYIDLDESETALDDGSIITFGSGETSASQELSVYSSVPLKNVETNNNSGNSPKTLMDIVSLSLDTLSVVAGTEFDANGLDLNVYGDFKLNGNFTANSNSTYFSGTVSQEITGSPDFWNLYKTTSNNLVLANDVNVSNELHLENGTLIDNSNTLSVQGHTWMNSAHNWGGSGDGILLNGTKLQVLNGTGTIGKLSINNPSGIFLPPGNTFTINSALQMQSGVLNIGKNLLTLSEDAVIIEQTAFSENNMIQTNISFTDAGVKKFFPEISSSETFIYPIGSEGKFTPVEFDISAKNAGGYIRVKGANEIHPTITNDTEPCNEIVDTANVLKYHWLIEASGITGFTANATMKYYPEDYQENSAFYDVNSYIAARLLWGSTLWNKFDETSFDEANELLRFSFSGTNDDGISGDYTAGVEDPSGSCKGAIPDEVPTYITIASGDWTDAAIWDTYPTSGGTIPAGGPRGAAVIIDHNVNMNTNYIAGYKTTINSGATLSVGTTFGHRLGIVAGQGTLQLERGNLPAGIYDQFFSSTGGTLEFTGNTDYDVLSEVIQLNNLRFTGTGERRLPNLDFEILGTLEILGDDATLEVINEHDRAMTIDGDVTFTNGSFDAGIGSTSKVIFGGSSNQTINGDFTGTNALWNAEINNAAGITLNGSVDIDNYLTLVNGVISTTTTNILTVNNTSESAIIGASTTKYIEGPMRKRILNGGDFVFPVGDDARYGQVEVLNTNTSGAQYWEVEYINANPHPTYDTSSYSSPLEIVSGNEYWRVAGPSAGSPRTASVKVWWDSQSVLPAMTTDRQNNLHVAQWSGTQWQSAGTTVNDISVNLGSIQTNSAVQLDEHYFTIASEEDAPKATATFTTGDAELCSGNTTTLSVALTGEANWSITIEEGGDSQTFTGIATSPYEFTVDTAGTYTITAVSDINGAGYVYGSPVTVTIIPVPTAFTVGGGGSYCGSGSGIEVTLDGSELGVNYNLLLDGNPTGTTVGGTGSPISFGNQTATGTYTVEAEASAGSCTQMMFGSAAVAIYPAITVDFTVDPALDTICDGDNTLLTIDFTSGTAPFDFTISDGTNPESFSNINTDPYTFAPTVKPVWVDDGTPSTEYTYTITSITDSNGCTDTNIGNLKINVSKIPETGPQYHISNN